MALIICPECGTAVSEQADDCWNCGFPVAEIRSPPARPGVAASVDARAGSEAEHVPTGDPSLRSPPMPPVNQAGVIEYLGRGRRYEEPTAGDRPMAVRIDGDRVAVVDQQGVVVKSAPLARWRVGELADSGGQEGSFELSGPGHIVFVPVDVDAFRSQLSLVAPANPSRDSLSAPIGLRWADFDDKEKWKVAWGAWWRIAVAAIGIEIAIIVVIAVLALLL